MAPRPASPREAEALRAAGWTPGRGGGWWRDGLEHAVTTDEATEALWRERLAARVPRSVPAPQGVA